MRAVHTSVAASLVRSARKFDVMNYMWGVRILRIILISDKSIWNADYSPDTDEITLEAKFFRKPYREQLQIFLHEVGHRGEFKADPETFKAFLKARLARVDYFLAMANEVHRSDFVKHGISRKELADEVFAESYARYALGLDMPAELKDFWTMRISKR